MKGPFGIQATIYGTEVTGKAGAVIAEFPLNSKGAGKKHRPPFAAELLLEALEVYAKTGLTPKQLEERASLAKKSSGE